MPFEGELTILRDNNLVPHVGEGQKAKNKEEQLATLELFQDATRGKVTNNNRGFFGNVGRLFGITL